MHRLISVLLLLFPAALRAQEVVGNIDGTLQSYANNWFVTSSPEGGQSSWDGDETYAWVSIFGHATANTVLETAGAISLTFEIVPEAGGYNVLAREIGYYRTPDMHYLSQTDKAEIQVIAAEFDDGALHISGKFAGTLGRSDDFGATIDMQNSRQVAGTFDTTLLLLE